MIDYIGTTLETGVAVNWRPCWCPTRDQRLIRINGLARGTIWDGKSAAPDVLGITAPAAGLVVATPTGGGAIAGTYYCAIRYKDATHDIYSSLSALVEVTAATGDKFSYTTIPVSSEARVTHIEIWRSTADQSEKLYFITSVPNSGSPTYTLDVGDDNELGTKPIAEQLRIYNTDGRTLQARRQGVPPTFMRVVVSFQDRWFYAVPAAYSTGTVSVDATAPVPGTDSFLASGFGVAPATMGVYSQSGTHNGMPAFTDGTYWLWGEVADWDATAAYWFITATKGSHTVVGYAVSGTAPYHMNIGTSDPTNPVLPAFLNPFKGATGMIVLTEYAGGAGGALTFTGSGTAWTTDMEGQKIYVQGTTKGYTIQSVDVGAQTLTISESYSGSALSGAAYTISPDPQGYTNIIVYSEQDEPESVPTDQNQFPVQENTGHDGDLMTGLMPHGAILWGLKQRHTYRITFVKQPVIDVSVTLAFSRGCLNQDCWKFFEDTAFLMDATGPWSISGDGGYEDIADMKVKNYWRDGLLDFGKANWWFVSVDPASSLVRFHVTLLGQTGQRPKTAMVYDVRRKSWYVEPHVEAFSGTCQITQLSRARMLLAGQYGRIVVAGEGAGDGCAVAGTISSATATGLTDNSGRKPFCADMIGYSVEIVRGTGAGQVRTISAVSDPPVAGGGSITLTVSEAWETNPDATSGYVVRYAIRGTCTSGGASGFFDTTGAFPLQLAGASVAIVSGTGIGQVRQIKNYVGSGEFSITQAWTTQPDATSIYLVGGMKCRYLTGLFAIPAFDPKGPSPHQRSDDRALILAWTPTEHETTMELRVYPDHNTTPETLAIGYADGALIQAINGVKSNINLYRTRSTLADQPGWYRVRFRMRALQRAESRHWFAAEMIWYQAQERVQIHSLELEGAS